MDAGSMKELAVSTIDKLVDPLIQLSAYLHGHPEIAFQEEKAVTALTDFLAEHHFSVVKGIGGLTTAFAATFPPSGESNKFSTVAFIAEYDALPVIGHGCGHNLIAASSVGAAIGMAAVIPPLPGKVMVIGTPAEEGGGGKIQLAAKGVFDNVTAAMMVHPGLETELVKLCLAMTTIQVEFLGKAAHAAATPEIGINALDGVILAFNNINALRQQLPADVRIHGIITNGGSAPNVIPEYASCLFYVRTRQRDYLDTLVAKVSACFKAAAMATGCQVKIKIGELVYEPFKPNYNLAELFRQNLKQFQLPEQTGTAEKNMGSSDIGNLSQLIPTISPIISIAAPGEDFAYHSPAFTRAAASKLAQERMIIAAKTMALTAIDLISQPVCLTAVRKEFMAS